MKATIELNGMVCESHTYEGNRPDDIVYGLMGDQDLYCLIRMGKQFGDDVSDLEEFMDKFDNGNLSNSDIKNLNIKLEIGTIKCVSFED